MALEKKEYLFNFVGGGWNSEFAKTRRGAKHRLESAIKAIVSV